MELITSPHNEKFKTWQSLLTAKGIKKSGLCLVSGPKVVAEILKQSPERVRALLTLGEGPLSQSNSRTGYAQYQLDKTLFNELDVFGTKSSLLAVDSAEIGDLNLIREPDGFELLLALQDPSNLGAALRSAAAFGVKRIVLLQEAAHPFLPKVTRSAVGANFNLEFFRGPSINELAGLAEDPTLWALHSEGQLLSRFSWPSSMRLLVGEEGLGLPPHLRDPNHCLKIPMSSATESLNAPVALSIALYERFLNRSVVE